jgi:hypothetical protein
LGSDHVDLHRLANTTMAAIYEGRMMEQLILHLIGDYVTQSDWMANGKTSKYGPAAVHAIVYSLPFLLLRPSWGAFAVICWTHFLIDRFRLAKYVVYAKSFIAPFSEWIDVYEEDGISEWEPKDRYLWLNCNKTGYAADVPVWLATWLMIIADNTMHLTINYLALRYL